MNFERKIIPSQNIESEDDVYRIDVGTYFSEDAQCDILVIDDSAEDVAEIELEGLDYNDVQKVKLFAQNVVSDAQRLEKEHNIKEPADEVVKGRRRRGVHQEDTAETLASQKPEDIIKTDGALRYVFARVDQFVKNLRTQKKFDAQQ